MHGPLNVKQVSDQLVIPTDM